MHPIFPREMLNWGYEVFSASIRTAACTTHEDLGFFLGIKALPSDQSALSGHDITVTKATLSSLECEFVRGAVRSVRVLWEAKGKQGCSWKYEVNDFHTLKKSSVHIHADIRMLDQQIGDITHTHGHLCLSIYLSIYADNTTTFMCMLITRYNKLGLTYPCLGPPSGWLRMLG